jgi:hypothetical protein
MFSKANLISTVVTTLWGFFGGFLLWGILADPYLMNHLGLVGLTPPEEPDFMFLLLGCFLIGLFFSTIYSKMASRDYSAATGAQSGILIGLLIGFGNGFVDFSTTGILDLSGTVVNGLVYVVHFLIMGVLASLVYKKFSD